MQTPSRTRPLRPLRWLALLCETGSTGRRFVRVCGLYRLIRAKPESIT
jgi:hypothetical protein